MYLLALGLVLMVMKYLEYGSVAAWPWWQVLVPFALAVVWWAWADSSGYTKRKAMERQDKRRDERRSRTRDALAANFEKRKR